MSQKGKLKERLTMKGQIHKAYKVLLKLQNPKYFTEDKGIPLKVIQNAKGIAFITVIKAGFVFSGTLGSGIVIARLPNGNWSGPSSIGVGGMGWGALIGASSTDSVIILNNEMAVKAFSGKGQIKFGGNLSVAVGPLGREGDASVYAGDGGGAACYSYSHSRGFFGGLSLQGAILAARDSDNAKFYGQKYSPSQILKGEVMPPPSEDYTCLIRCLDSIDSGEALDVKRNSATGSSADADPANRSENGINSSSFNQQNISSNSKIFNNVGADVHNLGPAFASSVTASSASYSQQNPSQPFAETLPAGWEEVTTADGEKYYWNEKENITQWEKPVPVATPFPKPLPTPSFEPSAPSIPIRQYPSVKVNVPEKKSSTGTSDTCR
mmetsp:Transcript_15399/g.18209  ORF Transcript_15399/g.18209 Transcript_15399/m.18209 type:complete len:381 (-) Transcript_15399:1238-2380(-)